MSQTVEYTIDLDEPLTPSQLSAFKEKFKDLEEDMDIESDVFISGTASFAGGYTSRKFADELTAFFREIGASRGRLDVTFIEYAPTDTFVLNESPPVQANS